MALHRTVMDVVSKSYHIVLFNRVLNKGVLKSSCESLSGEWSLCRRVTQSFEKRIHQERCMHNVKFKPINASCWIQAIM